MISRMMKTAAALMLLIALMPIALTPAPAAAQSLSTNACLQEWDKFVAARRNGGHALLEKHLGATSAPDVPLEEKTRVKAYLDQLETIRFRCRDFVPPPPGVSR